MNCYQLSIIPSHTSNVQLANVLRKSRRMYTFYRRNVNRQQMCTSLCTEATLGSAATFYSNTHVSGLDFLRNTYYRVLVLT